MLAAVNNEGVIWKKKKLEFYGRDVEGSIIQVKLWKLNWNDNFVEKTTKPRGWISAGLVGGAYGFAVF